VGRHGEAMRPRWLFRPFAGLLICGVGVSFGLVYVVAATGGLAIHTPWSKMELRSIRSLRLGALPAVPPDPSNRYADDAQAAELGHRLFFDARFSVDDRVSCATCHKPDRLFQDGLPRARGLGLDDRRTPSIVGAAYSPWLNWDGSADTLWAQATGPFEEAIEMGGDRTFAAHLIARHYRRRYEAVFGPLPADLARLPRHAGPSGDAATRSAWRSMSAVDRRSVSRVLANMGKAIEAYERKLNPGPALFDRYAQAVLSGHPGRAKTIYSGDQVEGLRLFIGAAGCIDCHNGPLFTNEAFENTGVPPAFGLSPDPGRQVGVKLVLKDPFNSAGSFSDAPPGAPTRLGTAVTSSPSLAGQFKTPSLRNVADIAPYMHAGQFATLQQVVDFYSRAPAAPLGRSLLRPLGLTSQEKAQLVAFLRTLSGPLAGDPKWLAPP